MHDIPWAKARRVASSFCPSWRRRDRVHERKLLRRVRSRCLRNCASSRHWPRWPSRAPILCAFGSLLVSSPSRNPVFYSFSKCHQKIINSLPAGWRNRSSKMISAALGSTRLWIGRRDLAIRRTRNPKSTLAKRPFAKCWAHARRTCCPKRLSDSRTWWLFLRWRVWGRPKWTGH